MIFLMNHDFKKRMQHRYGKAEQDLKEGREMAEAGYMKLFMTDYLLEYARLYGEKGEKEREREHYDEVEQLIEETGYKRRDKRN